MTYRSLLVYLDQHPQCDARIRMAIDIAKRLGSHLCGVAPTGVVEMPTSLGGAAAMADFAAAQFDVLCLEATRTTQRFADACSASGVASFDSIIDEGARDASLLRRAHFSDLTIIGQADPDADGGRDARNAVAQHVLMNARPTLVCPCEGWAGTTGERVLVAWDDSREATRALSDSLPLLRSASEVRLACWGERGRPQGGSIHERLEAVSLWLARHGVTAQIHLEAATTNVAQAIVQRAADWGSDLIVMGAYGHSRLAERLLGGASQGMLGRMTVPVLMSH